MRGLFILPLLFFAQCTRHSVVVTVGDFKIYQTDADFKNTITRIYYPNETRDLGLELLIKSFTYAQILKNNGHDINAAVLQKELERIEKSTLRPELLARIRGLFGDDVEAYKRVYVLPTYAERVIYYEFFLRNPLVQAESLKRVEAFISKVKEKPALFNQSAASAGLNPGKFTVSLGRGFQWEHTKDPLLSEGRNIAQGATPSSIELKLKQKEETQVSEEGKRWVEDLVKKLKPGQVYGAAIDRNESWLVARYLGPKPKVSDTYQFEGVSFPKADYGSWLEKEQKKVIVVKR